MRYLVTSNSNGYTPFLTAYFELDNNFNKELDMVVYDLLKNKFTTDGYNWHDITIDRL